MASGPKAVHREALKLAYIADMPAGVRGTAMFSALNCITTLIFFVFLSLICSEREQ